MVIVQECICKHNPDLENLSLPLSYQNNHIKKRTKILIHIYIKMCVQSPPL